MKSVEKGSTMLVLLLLAVLAASFAAAPEAQAAWTAVGTILNANNGTAGSSWAPTTSAQLDAGNVGVCVLTTDETGSGTIDGDNNQHNTPTDAAGNTWVQAIEWANMQSSTAANGANVSIWWTKATSNLSSGAAITFNFSASTTSKAVTCMEFTIGAGSTVTLAAGANGLANDAADPGSMTDATGVSRAHLFIRASACESNVTTYTADTDYVAFTGQGINSTFNSGSAATSMGARGESRIATESTSAASDPTYTAADCASAMIALDEDPPPVTGSFRYRKAITIDHTKVGNSGAPTTLANYPFLYNVTDTDLRTLANGGHVRDPVTVGVNTPTSGSGTATTIDVTHTVSGTNTLMLVGISAWASLPTVNTVVWDPAGANQALTLVGSQANGTVAKVWIYSLVAPTAGTKTLRVTFTGSANKVVGVMSFTGVSQSAPLGTFASAINPPAPNDPTALVVPSATGELVFETIAVQTYQTLTINGTPTQRWNVPVVSVGSGAGSTAPGAASVTMGWHNTSDNTYAEGGVSIKAVTGPAGSDIIFRALDATTCNDGQSVCGLDHEIESYDPTTGKFVAWVRVPSVNAFSASSDTVIYIYYYSDITTSTENPTGVWDSNFIGVWHLKETTGGAGAIKDSTSNANHMTDSGTPTLNQTGKINGTIDFDGVDDKLERAAAVVAAYPLTMCAWFYAEVADPTLDTTLVSIGDTATDTEYWTLDLRGGTAGNPVRFISSSTIPGGVSASTTTGVSAVGWYYACGVGTSASYRDAYINAGSVGNSNNSNTPLNLDTTGIGVRATLTRSKFHDAKLDEIRISNTDRSTHWITTEYNNMNLLSCGAPPMDATKFSTCGSEESDPPSAVKLRGARAVAYEGSYAQTVQLKWRTSHEVDHLGFHVYREQNGQLLRVTPSIVAGSALLARGRTELTAGQRYSWWDVLPTGGGPLQYWLEEVDLHGQRTWHGPIAVTSAKGRRDLAKPEQVRSVLLSKLGRGKPKGRLPGAPWQGAADAVSQTPTATQFAMQAQLAAGPAIKLGVSAEGWYRVDQPTLIAAGLDPKVDPRRLRLYADGREVPMVVTGAMDGRLQPRDAIQFYGVGLETPWTDTRTYWLVAGQQAGQRVGTSAWRGRTQSGPASFPYTVTWQPRELYFAALRNGEADNFFGPVVTSWPTEQAFTLNHLDPVPPGAARLEVTLQGVTDGPHAVDVQVNGTSVGTVTFDGQAQGRTEFSVLSSQLLEGANLVTLVALGGEMDVSLVATVRLTYWHTYQAEEDVLRGSVPAGQHVTIGGFSTKPIHVVDVTQPDAVRAVPGQVTRQGSSFTVTVVGPGPGTRTLLAFTDRIAATPAKIHANQPSQWHRDGHRADLVMIGHPAFLPSLATLKAWREQQGWTVALIDVEDLYDEFTFGAKSPWALRTLMETARTRWAQPPRFLLLGGDASFDPRDTQGMGETDFVPTKLIDTDMMETASDDWFGDLNGDGVAEVPVGRLAVRTAEEAATVVQKLIGYDETAAPRTAVLVADTPDSLDFEGASTRLAALLPSGMATQAIYRSQSDDATTRGALLAALNSGAWLVNYLGHGSVEVWRGEVFTSLDASTLTNGLRLPFVSTMTCLNGFFHDVYTESLAEALQRAPQGGALAVWASSSLSKAAEQVDMNRRLLQGLSAGLTLGEAVAQAKTVARNPDVRRTWILFGDPTTRLK